MTLRLLQEPAQPRVFWAATQIMKGMGQELFQPPNVKGWPGEERWITSGTLDTRNALAMGLISGRLGMGFFGGGMQASGTENRLRQRQRGPLARVWLPRQLSPLARAIFRPRPPMLASRGFRPCGRSRPNRFGPNWRRCRQFCPLAKRSSPRNCWQAWAKKRRLRRWWMPPQPDSCNGRFPRRRRNRWSGCWAASR